jgi:hypothetical protein
MSGLFWLQHFHFRAPLVSHCMTYYVSCHLNVPFIRIFVILPFMGCKTVNFCFTSSTSDLFKLVKSSSCKSYTNMKPRIFDSRTPRGSSSMPTLVIARIECWRTAGDSSWTSSISGNNMDSSWSIGKADACVFVFPIRESAPALRGLTWG